MARREDGMGGDGLLLLKLGMSVVKKMLRRAQLATNPLFDG